MIQIFDVIRILCVGMVLIDGFQPAKGDVGAVLCKNETDKDVTFLVCRLKNDEKCDGTQEISLVDSNRVLTGKTQACKANESFVFWSNEKGTFAGGPFYCYANPHGPRYPLETIFCTGNGKADGSSTTEILIGVLSAFGILGLLGTVGFLVRRWVKKPKTLAHLCKKEADQIPSKLKDLVRLMYEAGPQVDIYREPPMANSVELLKTLLSKEPNITFEKLTIATDVIIIAVTISSAVKDFFGTIADPVVPRELHKEIGVVIRAMTDRPMRIRSLVTMIGRFPSANRAVLKYMIGHFIWVVEHFATSKMDRPATARCAFPCLSSRSSAM